ncbi:hypothetical protein BCR42DRAFT_411975 [Absidia repens]|uniref:Uncharacterized protein n=1 Tax=Absidia repens TaxID=90262 RepID=A0A1X2IMI3_9FUNG|nr:hypothetical protein BCR42DRAFT_411975 [Absidia repens]
MMKRVYYLIVGKPTVGIIDVTFYALTVIIQLVCSDLCVARNCGGLRGAWEEMGRNGSGINDVYVDSCICMLCIKLG